MTRWGCPTCGTVYGLRLYAGCPRHPGTALVEEEHMPKITVHGGASNADDPQPVDTDTEPPVDDLDGEQLDEAFAVPQTGSPDVTGDDPEPLEEVPPSAGTSSSTSDAKPRKNTATRKTGSPSPARTTENP